MPARSARSSATFSHAMTFQVSLLALGNLAIATRPPSSRTWAFKAHVLDEGGRVAIAKFPSARSDTWNVMAWEKVALDLAERAGIDVPASRLLDLAGRHVLVVDRFDRTADHRRIGYVSAMTMLEAADGDQRSYLEIADVVEQG